ncbi:SCO4848 family membrane protein [Leifsonia sp. RAF41]|uniref:SCO4848 family membrane protein n=1 Tax=Leifsonia sp. RAF41 TaxID=3233056 RepID=UPI003F9D3800
MTVFAAIVLFLNAVFNVFAWPRFFARVRNDQRARDAAGRATPFLIVHGVLLGVALLLALLSAVAGVLLLVAG